MLRKVASGLGVHSLCALMMCMSGIRLAGADRHIPHNHQGVPQHSMEAQKWTTVF